MSDTKTILDNLKYVCPKKRITKVKTPKNWERARIELGSKTFSHNAARMGENERLNSLGFNKSTGGKNTAPMVMSSTLEAPIDFILRQQHLTRLNLPENNFISVEHTSKKQNAIIILTRIKSYVTEPQALSFITNHLDWVMGIRRDKPVL